MCLLFLGIHFAVEPIPNQVECSFFVDQLFTAHLFAFTIYDDNVHIFNTKKSRACSTDIFHDVSEGNSIKSLLETVLGPFQDRRHASLDIAADRAPLVRRIAVNRECRRRRACAIDVQKRYLSG